LAGHPAGPPQKNRFALPVAIHFRKPNPTKEMSRKTEAAGILMRDRKRPIFRETATNA
jgi:hypothetical protein